MQGLNVYIYVNTPLATKHISTLLRRLFRNIHVCMYIVDSKSLRQYILAISWILAKSLYKSLYVYFIHLFLFYYKANNFLMFFIKQEKNKEKFQMTPLVPPRRTVSKFKIQRPNIRKCYPLYFVEEYHLRWSTAFNTIRIECISFVYGFLVASWASFSVDLYLRFNDYIIVLSNYLLNTLLKRDLVLKY